MFVNTYFKAGHDVDSSPGTCNPQGNCLTSNDDDDTHSPFIEDPSPTWVAHLKTSASMTLYASAREKIRTYMPLRSATLSRTTLIPVSSTFLRGVLRADPIWA